MGERLLLLNKFNNNNKKRQPCSTQNGKINATFEMLLGWGSVLDLGEVIVGKRQHCGKAGTFWGGRGSCSWLSPRTLFPWQGPGIRTLPAVGAEPWRPYLLQAAGERGPLHVPGGLIASILLLQPPPCTFVFPQLHTQLLQQRLERAEQRLVLCHLRGHRAALASHKGEDRSLASKRALGPVGLQGGWEGICTVSGRAGFPGRLQALGPTLPRAHCIRMLAPQEPGSETGGSCGRPGGAKPGLPGHSA